MEQDFERYIKNINPFTKQEIDTVREKAVCIAGCGGLGGYTAMTLARFGVGKLTVADGDVFAASNLNRQIFCTEDNLGKNKAIEAKEALSVINSDTEVTAITEFLTENNCTSILPGHDVVMDCLDSIPARIMLEKACKAAGIPLIHGAISGFTGQVACIYPGDDTLSKIYAGHKPGSRGSAAGNPPFTPQFVAAMQCCEAIKFLTGRKCLLRKKLLLADMDFIDFQVIDIK